MSVALTKLLGARRQIKADRLPEDEQRALEKTLIEAKAAGATLEHPESGGLRPSLCLGVFRRARWRCEKCGSRDHLGVHHKGGLENPTSRWLAKKGHSNTFNNLAVLCEKKDGSPGCHDVVHEEDRARG